MVLGTGVCGPFGLPEGFLGVPKPLTVSQAEQLTEPLFSVYTQAESVVGARGLLNYSRRSVFCHVITLLPQSYVQRAG